MVKSDIRNPLTPQNTLRTEMENKMYSFDTRVRYSEVGKDKCMKLNSILNYFQDCSIFHSEDVDVGLDYLEARSRVWLMSAWQLIINRYPKLAEVLTVSTWPYDFKSMYGYRNFLLRDAQGNEVAYANSIWVYFDTKNLCPAKILPENMAAYSLEPRYDMEYAPRKIKLPESSEAHEPFPVIKSYLDNNNHVNNCVYVQLAQQYLPDSFKVRQMRADYRMSAHLGDAIVPYVSLEGNICTVVLAARDSKPFAIVEFTA